MKAGKRSRQRRERKPGPGQIQPPPAPGFPWERQPTESPEGYEAFIAFRECGPARTLKQAAERTGKSRGLMVRWSALHKWIERACAWDRKQWRDEEEAVGELRRESLRRCATDADKLQRLAMAKIGGLVRRDPATHELELDPSVTASDAVRIYKLGLEIQHAVAASPREDEQQRADDAAEKQLRQMSDGQLQGILALLEQRGQESEPDDAGNDKQ